MDYEKYMEYVREHHPERAKIAFVQEEWKPLIYLNIDPNKYMISNCGRLHFIQTNTPVPLGMRSGYYCANLDTIFNTRIQVDLHRLVAVFFVPQPGPCFNVVNHIDGNTLNNVYLNLEWVTQQQNVIHSFILGTSPVGSDKVETYTEDEDIHFICRSLEQCMTYDEIIEILLKKYPDKTYDKMRGLISNIKQHRTYKHISSLYNIDNKHGHSKFSSGDIHKICRMLEKGTSINELASEFNIDEKDIKQFRRDIGTIVIGKNHADISSMYNMKYPEDMIPNRMRFNRYEADQIEQYLREGKSYEEIMKIMIPQDKLKNMSDKDIDLTKKAIRHIRQTRITKSE